MKLKAFKRMIVVMAVAVLGLFVVNQIIVSESWPYVYSQVAELPEKQAIIVLGAYVKGERLSLVLKDRVYAGMDIYSQDKSEKILLTGDHGREDYDEVNGMRKFILNEGLIPEEAIFLDHAGFDTYDSMYRAKAVFGVESAIIVTQDFHIDRAVFIARRLGIDAVGYSVSEAKYNSVIRSKWQIREWASRAKAYMDVIANSKPKFLGDMIPITGDGRLSWDEND